MVDPALASNTRSRTRQAILSAACSVLAHNHTATLPEIADAAGVSRTTLRRYFPDRDSLMNAAVQDSLDALERSVDEAALDQGPPLEAMRRLVAAMVAVGDRLMFLFGDDRVLEGHEAPDDLESPADPVIALIERGQAEGVFDPEVSPGWIQRVLWGVVYTGCEDADQGRLPRHGVASTVIRTFENGIRAR
ncbi:TetR/AcrR family transcriptional regulator [Actinoalloteichus hymeniacidonis]|nr:TetR/AcrR family transcriptional regulator [Actinoalloteichus hymeniacidonis]MBB5908314.1 AcrR family transcriptional regulator [Actinoalloteichus hymeniacidonis]